MKKSKTWQDGILRVRTGRNQVKKLDLTLLDLISSASGSLVGLCSNWLFKILFLYCRLPCLMIKDNVWRIFL